MRRGVLLGLAVMQEHLVKLLVTIVVALFAWVWNTHAQVQDNTKTIERQERAVTLLPEIRTDMAVIKREQQYNKEKLDEVGRKLDAIIDRQIANGGHER